MRSALKFLHTLGTIGMMGAGLGAERITIWILLAVATANVVLGVWRPRLVRRRAT